jgi:hypothetical protein
MLRHPSLVADFSQAEMQNILENTLPCRPSSIKITHDVFLQPGQISPKPRHDYGVESRRFLQVPTAKGQQTGQNRLNVVIISTKFFRGVKR